MTLLRQLPFVVFVLALISVVAQGVAQESPLLLIITGTIAVFSWYVTEWKGGHFLPLWAARILVAGVVLYTLYESLQGTVDLRPVLGRFLLFLLLIKLYEAKTSQNYGLTLLLSFVLIIDSCLLVAGPLFALLLVSYIVISIWGLMLYQLFDARDLARQTRERPLSNRAIVPPLKPVYSRGLIRQFFFLSLVIAMFGLFISVTVFLFYPRTVQGGLLAGIMPSSRRPMAFDETIDLYGNLGVSSSTSRVFRVQIEDEAGNPLRLGLPLRFRASSFDVYEAGMWLSSGISNSRLISVEPDQSTNLVPTSMPEAYVRQRFLLNLRMRPLPCLYAPFAIRTVDAITLRYQPDVETLQLSPAGQRLVEYEIRSKQNPSDALLEELTDSTVPSSPPNYSMLDPRIQEAAYAMLDEAGVSRLPPALPDERWVWAQAVADVFVRELSSSEYSYALSLNPRLLFDNFNRFGDPVTWFLLDGKRGHCQFFATAMAVLCQSVGVEARIVTGFLCVLYDEELKEYSVLAQNAHAWTEVRTSDLKWATYDATPAAALNEIYVRDPSMIDSLRWLYEDLEDGWNSSILEFDAAAQQQIAQGVQFNLWAFLTGVVERIGSWARGVNQAFQFGVTGYIWLGIVASGVVVAIIVFIQFLHRRKRSRDVMQLQNCSVQHRRSLRKDGYFYVEMLTMLSKYGLAKPQWQSPLSFANDLRAKHESVAGFVNTIARRYYAIRYGNKQPSQSDREELRQQIEQLRVALEATQ